MEITSAKVGPAGAGAGNAAFLLVRGLLKQLHDDGVLRPIDINKIIDAALATVPSTNNPTLDDTRNFLESIRR